MGVKLFATDEAILSPDWVSNLALINAYDMRSGEFFFISRAYATHRKVYQQVLKEAKEFFDPNLDLLSKMALYTTRTPSASSTADAPSSRGSFLASCSPSQAKKIWLSKGAELRTREGEPAAGDQVVEGYTIQKVVAMTRTDACGFLRRGRHGKGGGNIGEKDTVAMDLTWEDEGHLSGPDPRVPKVSMPPSNRSLSDGRRSPEVATMLQTNWAGDRRQCCDRSSPPGGDGPNKRSALLDGQGHLPPSEESTDVSKGFNRHKRGFGNLVDRLQRDPFFQFNTANQDSAPEALNL